MLLKPAYCTLTKLCISFPMSDCSANRKKEEDMIN